MATEVYMPKNGMDMTEGTIVRWLKAVGDPVEKDEPIMEIETDKITMESESPASGILLKILYDEGSVVPVLTTVGYIGEEGEEVPDVEPEPEAAPKAAEPETSAVQAAKAAVVSSVVAENGIVPATPYARKLAEDHEIDLHEVTPSGMHGEVKGRDVEEVILAAPKATPLAKAIAADRGIDLKGISGSGYRGKIFSTDLSAPAESGRAADVEAAMAEIDEIIERRKLSGMRRVIAERMYASHSEIPTVTQNIKIDVTELLALREKINIGRESSAKVSVNDIIIKAVGIVVSEQERFRMSLDEDEYVLYSNVNIGVAVGLDDGLVVPVIHNVDRKGLLEVSAEAKSLAEKARSGSLAPSEMGDARITISNIGMYGTHSFTPIINQPEAAIVGVCAAEDELALLDGEVVTRKKMMVCVTYDHRILNGTEICLFELRLRELLENPVSILL